METHLNSLPKVGSVVEVVTRHKSHYYFAQDEFEEYHYVGVVVQNPKWAEHNSFVLECGDPEVDRHIISASNVVHLSYLEGEAGETIRVLEKPVKFKIKDYTVVKSKSGYTCTCVGYHYHRRCKHITEVMQMEKQ